jgi:hypothetical protein
VNNTKLIKFDKGAIAINVLIIMRIISNTLYKNIMENFVPNDTEKPHNV